MRMHKGVVCSLAALWAYGGAGQPAAGQSGEPPAAVPEAPPGTAPPPDAPPAPAPPTEGADPSSPRDEDLPPPATVPETAEPPEPSPSPPPEDAPPEVDLSEPYEPPEPFVLEPRGITEEERERAFEELSRYRGPFAQGRIRLSIALGGGTNFRDDYLVVGAGLGYFLLDGLEASVTGMAWFLGDPFIGTVTPGLTYVFYQVPTVHPYLGGFYRHYFIGSGFEDLDSYGGRAGVYLMLGQSGFIGGGAVYERLFGCQEGEVWEDCDQWYPELTFAIVF